MPRSQKLAKVFQWSLYDLLFVTSCVAFYFGLRQAAFHETPSYETRFLAWIAGPPFIAFVVSVLPTVRAKRQGKSKLEVFGVAICTATVAGLLGGMALQFESFFIQDVRWGWASFERQYSTLLTVHHIVLSSAGAGALSGILLGAVAASFGEKSDSHLQT